MCLIASLHWRMTGDDVAVHDLHVIEIEEEAKTRRADLVDDPHAVVDVIALEAGMAFHGVARDAGVEHLHRQVDLLLLSVADDLLESFDAVLDARLGIDFRPVRRQGLEIGICAVVPRAAFFGVAREGYHRLYAGVGRFVDPRPQNLQAARLVLRVVHALNEEMARRDGAGQTVFLERRPSRRPPQFDALAAELPSVLAHLVERPVRFKTPGNDGVLDVALQRGGPETASAAGATPARARPPAVPTAT